MDTVDLTDDHTLSLAASPPALDLTLTSSSNPSLDNRGVLRGNCKICNCPNYRKQPSSLSCAACGHPPVKHSNLTYSTVSLTSLTSQRKETPNVPYSVKKKEEKKYDSDDDIQVDGLALDLHTLCAVQGCKKRTSFDINTGYSGIHCEKHRESHTSLLTTQSLVSLPTATINEEITQLRPSLSVQKGSFASLHGGAIPFQKGVSLATPIATGAVQDITVPPDSLPSPFSVDPQSLAISGFVCKLPGCSKPVLHVDPQTNMLYDCCGLTHGRQYQDMMAAGTKIDPSMKCSNPNCSRPKFKEKDGTVYDFCGRSCRNEYGSKKVAILPPPPLATPDTRCMFPGCIMACSTDPKTGTMLSFCGQSHATQAIKQTFVNVPSKSAEYDKVLKHFDKEWIKKRPPPLPDNIMKINNDVVKSTFETYKKRISSNVEWYFHGTSLLCDLFANKFPCTDSKCGVCGIAKGGFDPKSIKSNIKFQRFGHGFYLAPNSSKCHDYTQGHKTYRAMILCDVAPGKKHNVKNDQTKLAGPPTGCNSVYGSSGGSLNYDEIVLYEPAAICPLYVIFYTKDDIGKIAK